MMKGDDHNDEREITIMKATNYITSFKPRHIDLSALDSIIIACRNLLVYNLRAQRLMVKTT